MKRNFAILFLIVASAGAVIGFLNSTPAFSAAEMATWPWPDLPEAANLRKNKQVKKFDCLTCHTIGNVGGSVGAILNQVGLRRDREWLIRWLKDPAAMKPGTAMPKVELPNNELNKLIDELLRISRPVDAKKILSETALPEKAGEKLMRAYDCYACHRIGNEGRFVGPDLTWINFRKSAVWERNWLKNPETFKPGTFMPNFHLTDPELDAIVAYLATLKGERHIEAQDWKDPMIGDLDRGEIVFRRFGCNGCHGEKGAGGWPNPNAIGGQVPSLKNVSEGYSREELMDRIRKGKTPEIENASLPEPPFRMPTWGDHISDKEMDYLVQYLFSLSPQTSEKW